MEDTDVSTSNFTALWNFEKLKGNDNYKAWARSCKNALQTMGVWHTCLDIIPPQRPSDTIVREVDGITAITKKTDTVYQAELTAWRTRLTKWHTHDRIARGHIFNKLTETPQDIVEDIEYSNEMWLMLQKRFSNQGYTKAYSLTEQMQLTTLSSCDGDIQKYTAKIQSLNKDLNAMEQGEPELKLTFKLLMNLEGKFKEYVSRTITQEEMPSFDKVATDLAELDRMAKHEASSMALRAQNRPPNTNKNTGGKPKGTSVKKDLSKKCSKCGAEGYEEKDCFVCHPEKKKAWIKKKDKAREDKKDKADKETKDKAPAPCLHVTICISILSPFVEITSCYSRENIARIWP